MELKEEKGWNVIKKRVKVEERRDTKKL
ncbi:hypothetical protein V1478_002907 [Vespula squamosa]|uniref:Uncharacterized protein n=1 Tax=Vespula squamosa TaxID=30214 RepID=A0ABD2BR57_VESSQ